jgi:transposase InsO family protein
MRRAGLEGRCKKRWRKTTIQDPAASAADLDLIQGAFDVGGELDVSYCGDITYTPGGWAHLATVIDISSRRVVGWALADHMRTGVVSDALLMAFGVACHRRTRFPLRSRLSVRPRTAGTSPRTIARRTVPNLGLTG